MEIIPSVQKYDWGKTADESFVAGLYKASGGSVPDGDKSPFAELWMGTHPSGPSCVKSTGVQLSDVIKENPSVLGEYSRAEFGDDLPFLLKVLSIRKALSIQAHPAKKHAEELHSIKPDLYKDPNHKPELAIALTPFKALCGFRPIDEIKIFLRDVEELREIVGVENAEALVKSTASNYEVHLKSCFRALMTAPDNLVAEKLRLMLERLQDEEVIADDKQIIPLMKTLYTQFPDDVGCFAPFFLNIINLKPGEAIFLGPNEPHAYISGDCVECMACSDNVVRAGLTPKFKDVDTLIDMLNYKGESAKRKIFEAELGEETCSVFRPPVPDFAVAKIKVSKEKTFKIPVRHVASIFIVISGEAGFKNGILKQGSVVFVKAGEEIVLRDIIGDLEIYQAMANV